MHLKNIASTTRTISCIGLMSCTGKSMLTDVGNLSRAPHTHTHTRAEQPFVVVEHAVLIVL